MEGSHGECGPLFKLRKERERVAAEGKRGVKGSRFILERLSHVEMPHGSAKY